MRLPKVGWLSGELRTRDKHGIVHSDVIVLRLNLLTPHLCG